jgi:hypothetical protein
MSSTVGRDQVAGSGTEPYDAVAYAEKGEGWIAFASIMLILGGFFGLMFGIVALDRASFYVNGAHYVFSDLNAWGWITIVVGSLAILAGCYVYTGSQWARWLGILVAGLQAIAQLLVIQAYPFWSLCVFAVDILIIYALAIYGGRPSITA